LDRTWLVRFCPEFQPDPQGPGAGPAHLPLGPDHPALFTGYGANLRHDAVPLGRSQPFVVTLPDVYYVRNRDTSLAYQV
jgi:hypothetical protein